MDIEAANRSLFIFLNAPAGLTGVPLAVAIGMAKYGDAALIAIVLWRWALGTPRTRRVLVGMALAVIAAMTANYIIGQLFPHPRPFVLGIGHTFISHRPDTSFPSDHATFMWTFALGFLLAWPRRLMSWVLVLLAALTSWARVFVGVHFPFDIVGSFTVAGLCVAVLVPLRVLIDTRIARPIEAIYFRGVRRLARPDPSSDLNGGSL